MVDTQSFLEQFMLRRHHVVILVLRKVRVHSVARLAGLSMADVVGKNDEVAARVEQLPSSKQHAGKL